MEPNNLNSFKKNNLITKIKELKNAANSNYYDLKYKFNFHSNKIEGSTFSLNEILNLMQYKFVNGSHEFNDVMETKNSLELFDYVISTIEEPITKRLILEYHSILKDRTEDDDRGFKGCFKKISNRILGEELKTCEPFEVDFEIEKLLEWWNNLEKHDLESISEFHLRFERIHPFQDGNGRVGRFILLRQCIESNIDPVIINSDNVIEYRKSLHDKDVYNFLGSCKKYKL